jgi:hypothetical protein
MSTSSTLPTLPLLLITISFQNIINTLPNITMLDLTFSSVLLVVSSVLLVSTSFAGAVVASIGIVTAIGNICGAGRGVLDGSCECHGAENVRSGLYDGDKFMTYLRPRTARKRDLTKYILMEG